MWVGGCVTAPVAWASGSSALASRGHGAVDVVGPMAPPGRASGRGYAGVYTDRRKWPLGAVLGHLCTLLRRCGQARGRRSVHRSAKMASRSHFGAFVYTVATRFAEASTHTDPRRASKNLAKLEMILEALQRREGLPEAAARPFPGRSVSRTSRMPYRTRLAPHLSYRRGGAHPYCNTHGKPQRAAGAMNVASVHNEASLCPTVTGLSAEVQRNEPERSRRRARSTRIPTGCARVMLMYSGPAASATHPRQVATPHEEPQPLAQPKGSSGEEGHCLIPRPQGTYRRQRKDKAHARDQLNVLDGMQRIELSE